MLIRRVSLDLIGLPPTLAEVDAFVNDTRPDAYERLVDRLLASPHHGERVATPWLDFARYADSNGWSNDRRRSGAYPYRDWVVKAFNDNMPFDRFVIEQLAGDMLPECDNRSESGDRFRPFVDVERRGRHRPGGSALERAGGPDQHAWATSCWDPRSPARSATTTNTIRSLQKDYYAMVAFFNNAKFDPTRRICRRRSARFPRRRSSCRLPELIAKRDALKAEIKKVESQIKELSEFRGALEGVGAFAWWTPRRNGKPLQPTRAYSPKGSTLTVSPDASVLVSGSAPENDIYVIEARSPLAGAITGIQIEAIPDPSLPNGRDKATLTGGPGRDYYGNFLVQRVELEAGPAADALVEGRDQTQTDTPSGSDDEVGLGVNTVYRLPQAWMSDVLRGQAPDKGTDWPARHAPAGRGAGKALHGDELVTCCESGSCTTRNFRRRRWAVSASRSPLTRAPSRSSKSTRACVRCWTSHGSSGPRPRPWNRAARETRISLRPSRGRRRRRKPRMRTTCCSSAGAKSPLSWRRCVERLPRSGSRSKGSGSHRRSSWRRIRPSRIPRRSFAFEACSRTGPKRCRPRCPRSSGTLPARWAAESPRSGPVGGRS